MKPIRKKDGLHYFSHTFRRSQPKKGSDHMSKSGLFSRKCCYFGKMCLGKTDDHLFDEDDNDFVCINNADTNNEKLFDVALPS